MGSEIAETPPPEVSEVTRGDQSRHPTALWFFFWGEFAERCSYYGMRAILPLYLTSALHFSDALGGSIYGYFKMTCYMLPLLGGFLADRYFGKYWTIVGFSVPYVLGHFILGIPTHLALFIALGLLAGGSGVIKPNISTLMGQTYDKQRPGNEQLRSAAFLWFYFSINVGALLSQSMLPKIRDYYAAPLIKAGESVAPAYAIAFQFPAWIMMGALIVFALGKRFYALDTFEREEQTPQQKREQWQTLVRLFGIFALIVLFWAPYEQNDTQWVFFTRDHVDLSVPLLGRWFGWTAAPDQLQFINALFVLIFVPLFTFSFKRIDPQMRFITATKKMLVGFAFTAGASGLMSAAGYLAQSSGEKVSMLWVVFAYISLTAGEVLLYGTGLELAYAHAPKKMKSFVTACFLLTDTVGNFINATFLAPHYGVQKPGEITKLAPGPFFLVACGIALAGTIGFYFVARKFDRGPQAQPAAA